MSARPIPHTAITASAGSGKTFQLAHRYIALLARGVPPARICALTFSRKAAGEIFDSIVNYLCRAAADPAAARATAARIDRPDLDAPAFGALLRAFLDEVHRSRIGTLDSFFVGILRAFPTELGFGSSVTVTDEKSPEARALRLEVLDRLLAHRALTPAEEQAFFDAFHLATVGRTEKNLIRCLDGFIDAHRTAYLDFPDPDGWGGAARIWGGDDPWAGVATPAAAAARLAATFVDTPAASLWAALATWLAARTPGDPLGKDPALGLLHKLLAAAEALRAGDATLTLDRKKTELGAEPCAAAAAALDALLAREYRAALHVTAGIFAVLARYDRAYREAGRRLGQLSFTDVQRLLHAPTPEDPGMPDRLYLDYRLDGGLDHWLLDEFQDTSNVQWAAIRNLIEEVLQSSDGSRTFFCVGDVKQAIYGWRGGNAQLLGRILSQYAGNIEIQPLHESRRSGPAVIDLVNAVFGDLDTCDFPLVPGAAARWAELWQPHASRTGLALETTYAALLHLSADAAEDGDDDGETDRHDAVAACIADARAASPGLTIAVLVRSNRVGDAIADALRTRLPAVAIVREGAAGLADNPAVLALLALLRAITHPGDSAAWRHACMSPLGVALARTAARPPDAWVRAETARMQEEGFTPTCRRWRAVLESAGALDACARGRLDDLEDLATATDTQGDRTIDAFIDTALQASVREAAQDDAVRVMTIHQSKGLGFDLVILPQLDDRADLGSGGAMEGVHVQVDPAGEPQWALRMPNRAFAQADPVLAGAVADHDTQAVFEELCVLYVALTRARRALYLFGRAPKAKSVARTAHRFVAQRLAGGVPRGASLGGTAVTVAWEAGNPRWAVGGSAPPAPAAPPSGPRPDAAFAARARPASASVEPSAADEERRPAASLFQPELRDVLDFGTLVHALFEQVEWSATCDPAAIRAPGFPPDGALHRDASAQFRHALATPAVRAALARPAGPATLWRERKFDVILDDRLVSGIFDRVVLHGEPGAWTRAEVLDFKTNRVATPAEIERAAERYGEQLALYRRALACITGLSEANISTALLFTRPAVVAPIPAPG